MEKTRNNSVTGLKVTRLSKWHQPILWNISPILMQAQKIIK